jgi:hypothetical protein
MMAVFFANMTSPSVGSGPIARRKALMTAMSVAPWVVAMYLNGLKGEARVRRARVLSL